MSKKEYVVRIRERGEVVVPRELCKRYSLTQRGSVRLIPKTDGILIKPRSDDPVSKLRGLTRGVWPRGKTSVEIIREIRRRVDIKAKQQP